MKYTYEYKLSGGERRAGVCDAPSKEAVFAILRKEGIKPFNVRLAPGFNNRLLSLGKRGIVIALLLLVCIVLTMFIFHGRRENVQNEVLLNTFDSEVRRQIIGDAAIIDRGVRTGWADLFALNGERFLASFAIPGVVGAVTTCGISDLKIALAEDSSNGGSRLHEGLEARQIRAIVRGMKKEAKDFISDGGNLDVYMRRLVQRTNEELRLYTRVKNEIEKMAEKSSRSELVSKWKQKNFELRRLGLQTLKLPKDFSEDGHLTE